MTTRSFLAAAAGGLASAWAKDAAQPIVLKAKAPEFYGKDWINPHGPVSWKERHGTVTVVHFWTYLCINCRHNLPSYERWRNQFDPKQVEIVGIHSPEFPAEAKASNVERKVHEYGISWPVLLDPDLVNWRRWNQQFWPAVYLVDKKGRIRYRWEGELNYGKLNGERRMAALATELLHEGEDA